MARFDVPLLDTGSRFPEVTFDVVGEDSMTFPGDCLGKWTVFLVNRGHW